MKLNIIKFILGLLSFAVVLSISIPEVSGLTINMSIDKRIIHKVIQLHRNEIQACYETALLKEHTLKGRVVVLFVIVPNGKVSKALIKESTLNNPEVEQCVIEHIKKWVFYSFEYQNYLTGILVEYPFEFNSNYKPPIIKEHVRVILNEDDMKIDYLDAPPPEQEKSDLTN